MVGIYLHSTVTLVSDKKECLSIASEIGLASFLFHSIPSEMSKTILYSRAVCFFWLLYWVLTSILK